MLELRQEQLDLLSEAWQEHRAQELARIVKQNHGTLVEGFPDYILTAMVLTGVARAYEFGFETDQGLVAFIGLMFEIGPNFFEHPVIEAALLDAPDSPEDARLDSLIQQVPDDVWEQVSARYDSDSWFPEEASV